MRAPGQVWLLAVILLVSGNAALADASLRAIDNAIATSDYDYALELIDTQLALNREDTALRLRRARVLGYRGEFDAALKSLNELQREYPQDVDHVFARAQLLTRQGRDGEAIDDLRRAVALAPDYEEVWQLRYTLLTRQLDESAEFELQELLQEVAIRFPRAEWWRPAATDSAPQWTILVGAGHENLSNDAPSWNRQFVEVSREQHATGRYRIGLSRDERFGNSDLSVRLSGDYLLAPDWSAGADITLISDPDFQPELNYSGYVGRSLKEGWVVNLRYRRREYETATVSSTTGVVEKYVGDFRIAYALGLSHLHGTSDSPNHSLAMNWYYSDRSSIGLTLNTGKETEAVGPGQVLETEVRGVSLSGRRKLSDRFDLQWWLGLHDQGDIYRRQFLGMAVSIRL
ncbi:MAG: YaiO family outer membrane beta-barrel protein [Gammaproteobacteria bacterium]|nr:YaiO family outer membrane beta-barrel protein [Gammaproteobacteria bacterium]